MPEPVSVIGDMRADEFVEAMLTSASDAIAVSERKSGRFVVVSDSYCRLTGYARDELIGHTSVELGLVADHGVRARALSGVDQEPRVYELEITRKDGAARLFEFSMQLLPGGLMLTISRDATEPRRLAAQLREQEERFRLLAENSRDVIRLYDADATILYASPSCRAVLGYLPEELVGHQAGEFQHPDDVAGREGRRQAVSAAEKDLTVTYRSRHGDGGYVWLESSLRALRDEPGGAVTGFQEAARDVGERKQADQALRASEERYRELFEESPTGRLESTATGTPLRVNRAFASLLGYASPEQFMATVTNTSVLYADQGEREPAAALLREHGGFREFDLRMKRRDGTTVWVAIDGRAVTSAEGGTPRWQASVIDISERKQAEEALRESEERFRLLAENSTDVITRVSTQSIMHYVSPSSRELHGYAPEEMVGHSTWEYIHPKDHARVRQAGDAVRIRGGHDHTVEYRAKRKDGSYVWVESKVRTLWNPVTGQAAEFQNATRDISERKRANTELLCAKEEAEQSNRAKSDFLAGMSHELRTPLNAILGFTGTLLMGLPGPLNDEQTAQLRRVQHGGKHLLSLINDLLDLAQIESGKVELHLERIECPELLEEVADGLRGLAEQKGLVLEVERCAETVELICDRRAASQILINLTNNAIKFTDMGTVRLEVSQRRDASRSVTRFAVTDTGRGVAPEDHARLFAAFQQIENAGVPAAEGTGLGLHISQALAVRLGGNITFESVLGAGSTFALEVTRAAG